MTGMKTPQLRLYMSFCPVYTWQSCTDILIDESGSFSGQACITVSAYCCVKNILVVSKFSDIRTGYTYVPIIMSALNK
jgi:hypothetical protein